jgi:hypothetical protein
MLSISALRIQKVFFDGIRLLSIRRTKTRKQDKTRQSMGANAFAREIMGLGDGVYTAGRQSLLGCLSMVQREMA